MATQTIEQELIDLEKQYWQAIKDKDVDAAMRLTDDTCIVAGAQGVATIDRKAFAGMLNSGEWTLDEFEVDDNVQVRLVTDDVALVGYKVKEKLTVDGKPVTLDAADASAWVRRNGGWLCAMHAEAIAGDPYGRDRQPVK
jgi:ketosteroid isomerase-like protein